MKERIPQRSRSKERHVARWVHLSHSCIASHHKSWWPVDRRGFNGLFGLTGVCVKDNMQPRHFSLWTRCQCLFYLGVLNSSYRTGLLFSYLLSRNSPQVTFRWWCRLNKAEAILNDQGQVFPLLPSPVIRWHCTVSLLLLRPEQLPLKHWVCFCDAWV